MTNVEHYALSLLYLLICGICIGQGAKINEQLRENGRLESNNILTIASLAANLAAWVYVVLGFKHVDGPHLIFIPGVVAAILGYATGKAFAQITDSLVRYAPLGCIIVVVYMYHRIL